MQFPSYQGPLLGLSTIFLYHAPFSTDILVVPLHVLAYLREYILNTGDRKSRLL